VKEASTTWDWSTTHAMHRSELSAAAVCSALLEAPRHFWLISVCAVLCYLFLSPRAALPASISEAAREAFEGKSITCFPVRKTCSYRCGDALSWRKGLHSTPRSAPEGRYSEEPVLGANNTQKISELQGTMCSPSREWEGGCREKTTSRTRSSLSFFVFV